MAPRKTYTAEPSLTRITRSSTRPKTQLLKPESPKKKIAKAQKKPALKADKKAPKAAAKAAEEIKKVEENGDLNVKKTVIIEHCKQCNSFKVRALQVKSGLEKGVDGVNVVVNPEKPRRGCFEIREEGQDGEKFVSLLDLKRPFGPMKDLDMEQREKVRPPGHSQELGSTSAPSRVSSVSTLSSTERTRFSMANSLREWMGDIRETQNNILSILQCISEDRQPRDKRIFKASTKDYVFSDQIEQVIADVIEAEKEHSEDEEEETPVDTETGIAAEAPTSQPGPLSTTPAGDVPHTDDSTSGQP